MAQIFVPAAKRRAESKPLTFTDHYCGHLRCDGAALFRFGASARGFTPAFIAKPRRFSALQTWHHSCLSLTMQERWRVTGIATQFENGSLGFRSKDAGPRVTDRPLAVTRRDKSPGG